MELDVLDLDPKSIAKIFNAVDAYTDLCLDNLKSKEDLQTLIDNGFNFGEKYFTIHYIKQQLDIKNKRSRLYQVMKEYKESEDSEVFLEHINSYAAQIRDYCNVNELYLREKYELHLDSRNITSETENEAFNAASKWKRLPIAPNTFSEFRQSVYDIFRNIIAVEDIDEMMTNSFDIKPFPDDFKLLNLKCSRKEEIDEACYKLYKLYIEQREDLKDVSDTREKQKSKYMNKKIGDSGFSRADFISNDVELHNKATTKINIAKIMFTSFPYIRSNYNHYKMENGDISIEKYLEKVTSKNIRKKHVNIQ